MIKKILKILTILSVIVIVSACNLDQRGSSRHYIELEKPISVSDNTRSYNSNDAIIPIYHVVLIHNNACQRRVFDVTGYIVVSETSYEFYSHKPYVGDNDLLPFVTYPKYNVVSCERIR